MAVSSPRPGARLGTYPQRWDLPPNTLERWLAGLSQAVYRRKYKLSHVVAQVDRAAANLHLLEEEALGAARESVRYELMRDGLTARDVFRSFALVREYARRSLQMRYYDEQVFGAWVIVNGHMAEMATGEGKSFTATLAAATAALAGIPVHIITTNEYLAQRDADEMRPLFEAMGLRVTAVLEEMDTPSKRSAYAADIVYCTNKQIAFDYLRDRLVLGNESGPLSLKFSQAQAERQVVLRGLCFAIVDEADSVLIDEARTPLILSQEHRDESQEQLYAQALALARGMQGSRDFELFPREHKVQLTERGKDRLAEQTKSMNGIWSGRRHSQFLVHQALSALHLFQRDTDYLVRDDKVEIIDRNTGRTMADRSWQQGLHQMIECKEACKSTGQRQTLASISYQRFFRRYLRLGGMSGTLHQVAGEMGSVYGQQVIKVPTHRPCQRSHAGITLYRRAQEKWLAVLGRLERIHASGRPVLICTGSVYDSELLSALLTRRRLIHRVLNARQDQDEAEIVALAGQRDHITIATNMAGRGTDIKLGDTVAEIGGLHVISTECHEEFRVDRQLYGRCARQGDPGSTETLVSLGDSLIQNFYSAKLLRVLGGYMGSGRAPPQWLCRLVVRLPQHLLGRSHRSQRQDVLKMDENLGKILAYSGRLE